MLRLLGEVSWQGDPVASERGQALLAVLVGAGGRAVGEAALFAAVWSPGEVPANAAKALQVVVSRTRAQLAAHVVTRTAGGYRLGLDVDEVDSLRLGAWLRDAVRAEARGDLMSARDHSRAALGIPVAGPGSGAGVLEELRDTARREQATAGALLGRSASGLGDHAEALAALEWLADPDEATLAALLRSEAAVHGAPAALAHYARHRADVRDRLGVDPGPQLQAMHAELLAADNPVRTGLGFDVTSLVGRDDDLRRLRALVGQSRVTSIVGPGGLGKTRLARLLGREAEQPVVHFVELVGVASAEDVVGEIGSQLGVRDSVSGRKVLTPDQLADVRGRLAQQLDQAPTLLILDNCEQVVDAVADLVAPLVAATRRLRVVTTTRSPLGIAAERFFALGQLSDDAAAALFVQRARAARPDVRLDPDAVRRVVARLDGLPLAIELAAAKVRAMTVDDIDRRLGDRFALLRGGDRGAPDRHRTLLAVIDWSWNLLGEAERRALRRLAVFQDGFALEAAEQVLGVDALGSVESLVGQSLVSVREGASAMRYRMLETVREFGRLRLRDAGEEDDARAAVGRWGVALCQGLLPGLHGPLQVETVRALGVEESNLADVLRECLAAHDLESGVFVLAALGDCWTIRGEHPRIIAMTGAVDEALEGWVPPAEGVDAAARAAGVLVMNSAVFELPAPVHARALLDRYGPTSDDPGTRALQAIMGALDVVGSPEGTARIDALAESPDRHQAMLALRWKSHNLENSGDAEAAVRTAELGLALWRPEDGVWERAQLDTQVAGLHAQLGRIALARRHAEAGVGVMDALEARDDAIQLRSVLALAALADGDLLGAERLLDEMAETTGNGVWGGSIVYGVTRAELFLARGEVSEGLALYREAVAQVRDLRFPGMRLDPGFEPWTLYIESAAVAAHAWHGRSLEGASLAETLRAKLPRVLSPKTEKHDFPVTGSVIFATGLWALLRDEDAGTGVACLVVASRLGYNGFAAAMRWDRATAAAERSAPGELDRVLAGYGTRDGADLLAEARTVAGRL
ncbi:BTAD domain-containing putative transcriptional regulator [soil metagenome]